MTSRRLASVLASGAVVASIALVAPGAYAGGSRPAATALTPPTYESTLVGPAVNIFYPSGIAYDSALNRVVVADTGLDRIDVYKAFQSSPTLIEQFGTPGPGVGQMLSPRDVAVDPQSDVYVADADNNRIEKFGPSGNPIWIAGEPVNNKQVLNNPIGISYDTANNQVLVADTGHSLIRAYAPDPPPNSPPGTPPALLWTSPANSVTGIASPRDAVRGPDGLIWVADYHHNQVKAFAVTPGGSWASTPAIVLGDGLPNGHNPGELNGPYNVAFSPGGQYVYVSDTGNERVAEWHLTAAGATFVTDIGSRCDTDCPPPPGGNGNLLFLALRRVAVDPAGRLWVADFWGSAVHEIAPTSMTSLKEWGGTAAPTPGVAQAFGIATAPDGSAYVVDRLNQRVEEFNPAGQLVAVQGKRGTAPGDYSWPEAATVTPDGIVWVGDTRNGRLVEFPNGLSGKPTDIGSTSSGKTPPFGTFGYITGLASDPSGNVWVADSTNNRIQKYTPSTGGFTGFGTRGKATSGSAQFIGPQGVAATGSVVYVADTGNNRIVETDNSGNILAVSSPTIGLNGPQGVTLGPDGTVWVADTLNDRVVHLSSDLQTNLGDGFGMCGSTTPPPPAWPVCGNAIGDLYLPHSLAISGSTLFVADTFNNRVLEYNITGS
jgi:DNA-binding beta-propeller fold protein YncE